MENKKKRIVIALGGNALGNTLPEQMIAVKITAKAIVDLIEEGCEVIVAHGNGPQVGMINNPGVAATLFEALYDANININMISTSEIKISVLVDKKDADKAVQVIHDKFFSMG